MKFRIVEIVRKPTELKSKVIYVIQKKGLFSWKEVMHREVKATRIPFDTYPEAEDYMRTNYMGYGECVRSGNTYKYTPYVMAM